MEQSLRRESFYRAGGKHIAILCYVYFYFIFFILLFIAFYNRFVFALFWWALRNGEADYFLHL